MAKAFSKEYFKKKLREEPDAYMAFVGMAQVLIRTPMDATLVVSHLENLDNALSEIERESGQQLRRITQS